MKKQIEDIIKIKIAISLRKLLNRNKSNVSRKENRKDNVDSYEKISMNADIRKATVSSAFNGETRTSMTTLILIIEAMEYNLKDFAEVYDKITENEIASFKKEFLYN